MNVHVEGKVKGTSGGGGSLDDVERTDEPGLQLGGWVYVLEVEVMRGEANHITNKLGHMAMIHVDVVPLPVLSMGDVVITFLMSRMSWRRDVAIGLGSE